MPQSTHIVILSTFFDPFMSGAEMCVKEIVARLGRRQAHVFTIITARLSRDLPRYENRGRYVIFRVGWGTRFDKWLYPFLALRLTLKMRPHVIHAIMESYAGIALWLIGIFWPSSRRILTLQSGDLDEKARDGQIPSWLWRRIHSSPNRVTAISKFLQIRANRLGASRINVIPNGVNLSHLRQIANSRRERDKNMICCVARLSEEKGVQDLIESFSQVALRFPDAHLTLIGDGPLRGQLEARVQELNLSNRVIFRGRLPHKEAMQTLARASIATLPSHGEGLGIAALEAAALGVPLVASRVGGIPEIVEHERSGLLCESGDITGFAREISRLLDDVALQERIRRSSATILDSFDWNTVVKQYRVIYKQMIRPRVLIATGIYPPDPGGPATYVTSLTRAMVNQEYNAKVICYGTEDFEGFDGDVLVKKIGRDQSRFFRYLYYTLSCIKWGRSADIIYAQDTLSSGLPARLSNLFLKRTLVAKVVGDPAWESACNRGKTSCTLDQFQTERFDIFTELIRNISRWVARGTDKIITPSQYLKGIVKGWGVDEDCIEIIYNGVFFPKEQTKPNRWPKSRILLYVGRLVPWKGLDNVIEVMPALLKEMDDITLVLIGDGPEREALASHAARINVQDKVRFLGSLPRSQVRFAMENADLFVLYSTYEGLSHVLIEAQMSGLPVVASTAGGNPEVVKHKHSGMLVPLGDNLTLLKSLRILLADRLIAETFADRGKRETDRFTRKRMVEHTLSFFEDAYHGQI